MVKALKAAEIRFRQSIVRRMWRFFEVRKRAERRRTALHNGSLNEDHVTIHDDLQERISQESRLRVANRFRYFRRQRIPCKPEPSSDENDHHAKEEWIWVYYCYILDEIRFTTMVLQASDVRERAPTHMAQGATNHHQVKEVT